MGGAIRRCPEQSAYHFVQKSNMTAQNRKQMDSVKTNLLPYNAYNSHLQKRALDLANVPPAIRGWLHVLSTANPTVSISGFPMI